MRSSSESSWIWEHSDWPVWRWDAAALAGRLAAARRAQGRVAGIARLLDPALDLAAQLDLISLEGASTSAIEGERLDPASLRSSVARHLGLPSAGLPAPSREIDGLVDVLTDASRGHAAPLTVERLCGWQAALFPSGRSAGERIRVGALRADAPMRIVSGPVGRERVHYVAPPREILEPELARFLAWLETPADGTDGLIRAGIAHAWFEVLHPFEDGNGRIGRAVLDLCLARDERSTSRLYSVSSRFMAERPAYYAELERLSSGGLDITPWLAWFLEQVRAAAEDAETITSSVVTRARFWLRHGALPLSERQRKALNRMLDAGPAGFEGGMTTRKYARLTGASTATAQRDLAALVEHGCLRAVGHGRSVRYELVSSLIT